MSLKVDELLSDLGGKILNLESSGAPLSTLWEIVPKT